MVVGSTSMTTSSVGDEGGGGRHSNQGKGRQSKGSSIDRPSDSNDHNESEQSHRKETPSSSSHAAGDTGSAATSNNGLNNSFVESVVQVALGQICSNIGWHSIGSLSLDILTEVTGSYIKSLGRTSSRFANQAGRSAVTLSDVVLGFEQLHFNLNELQDYVSSVEPHPIPFRLNKIPAKIRPSNRLQFRQQEKDNESHPFKEDTVIGYAVTDSEEEEEEEDQDVEEDPLQKNNADQDKMESNEDLVDPVTGQVLESKNNEDNKRVKEKKRIPLKRSEYYEEWMPPFPVIEDDLDKNKDREDTGKDTDKDASFSQDESSMSAGVAAGPEEALNGLKLSEIEPSAPLTSVYLNSCGQLVPVNGAVAIQADKSFPELSDPESASESEEEDESLNKSNDMDVNGVGGLYSTEGRQSLVDKITIKKDRMLNKSDKKTKRQGGDKLNRLISKQTKDKSSKGSSVPVLSIKVSGLKTGTPTASPKLPSMMINSEPSIPLPPEVEERVDDTIESVIESAMSSSRKTEKKPREKKAREPKGDKNKPQKEYSSKEFVDDDDDDSSSDDDASRGTTGIMEPVPPVLLSNSKSSFKKKDFSPEKEIKSSPGRSLSPDEHHYRFPPEKTSPRKHPVPPPTKAASKAYSTPSPSASKINDKDAAEILMSFSTNPVDQLSSKAMSPSSSSPVDSSPFNLGKILERSRVGQQMIGSPSETHPFAPNPPQSLPPIRTLAMKKAVYQETRDRQSESDESNEDDEDVKKKESKRKRVKEDDDDESLERKKSKKDKKKKKKESKDRDKKDRDRKKDKKEKKRKEREESAATIESVPRLNIKLSKPEASKESSKNIKDKDVKIKKEKSSADSSASKSCLLFTETIKQSSSVDVKTKGMKKENLEGKKGSKKLKEEEDVSKGKAGKPKSKGKKKEEEEEGEDEGDDKIWICPSCKLPDDGSPMIGCDICEEWYHWVCVGIKIDPEEDSWFCPRCKDKQMKMEQLIQKQGGSSVGGKRKRNDSTASKASSTSSVKKKRKKKKPG